MSEKTHVPKCVGIILDGNRRWAKKHGKPTLEGHTAGSENLEHIVRHVRDRGIAHVVVYAFSSENWKRGEEEVAHLMSLIVKGTKDNLGRLKKEGVRIRVIGDISRLPKDAQKAIQDIEKEDDGKSGCTLWVCLSYGGRLEITEAVKLLQKSGEEVTEKSLRSNMWSAEMPDPDLIIRTSGEQRLSNFLLWQAAYSELFFTETLWPDFAREEFDRILEEYGNRERRRGK